MKTRNGLVSNSSTSSFIFIGWELKPEFAKLLEFYMYNMKNKDEVKINNLTCKSPYSTIPIGELCLYNGSCSTDRVCIGLHISELDHDGGDITLPTIHELFDNANKIKDQVKDIVINTEPVLSSYLERV